MILLYFGVGLCALYYALLFLINGRRKAGEPPLITGSIPFMGVAFEYGKDADKYVMKCREKYGDIFTLFIAGKRMTFLVDPFSSAEVFKNPKALDFIRITKDITNQAFDGSSEVFDIIHEEAGKQYRKYLQGDAMHDLTNGMRVVLVKMLEKERKQIGNTMSKDELYSFVCRWIFESSGTALFGQEFKPASPQFFGDFQNFDSSFRLLVAGMPSFMVKTAVAARSRLREAFIKLKLIGESALTHERQAYFESVNISPPEIGSLQTAILWASQANTAPGAFWTLAFILADPALHAEVLQEIKSVCDVSADPFCLNDLDKLVRLEGCMWEAFRMCSSSMSVREVVPKEGYDVTVVSQNRKYHLRHGDTLVLAPTIAAHLDPTVHENPDKFDSMRFITTEADGTLTASQQKKFFKNGQVVPYSLTPFGGGVSLCPGRYWAKNEVKLFVAMFLYNFDAKLVDPKLPDRDSSRAGLGILPPVSKVFVEYSARKQ